MAIFKALGVLTWLVTAASAAVVWSGGVIRDEEDIRRTQELQLQVIEKRQQQIQQRLEQQREQGGVAAQASVASAPAAA